MNFLVTPGALGLVNANVAVSPNNAPSALATADCVIQCAHGYSGWRGVEANDSHAESRSVASFPSWSPLRIAVTGRQKRYAYLASNTAMTASAAAMATNANTRALSSAPSPCAATAWRATGMYVPGPPN